MKHTILPADMKLAVSYHHRPATSTRPMHSTRTRNLHSITAITSVRSLHSPTLQANLFLTNRNHLQVLTKIVSSFLYSFKLPLLIYLNCESSSIFGSSYKNLTIVILNRTHNRVCILHLCLACEFSYLRHIHSPT